MTYIIEFVLLLVIIFTSLVMGIDVEKYYNTDERHQKSILNLFSWYALFMIVLVVLIVLI